MPRPRLRSAFVVVLLLGGASTANSAPAARAAQPGPVQPAVRGNQLIDARTGETWIPHGVNWPDLEYACVQGWVPEHPENETQLMADWGVDVVRLPLNQDCWLGVDGAPTGEAGTAMDYRALVQSRVDAVHAAGMTVILDLHWTGPAGVFAYGQRSMADAQSVTFWSSIAAEYADDPAVMFELFNEPFSRGVGTELSWACWRDGGCPVAVENDSEEPAGDTFPAAGMASLVAAVRATGATQPLLLGGLNYSNDLTGWLANAPDDDQLVAAWHNYPGQGCWTECWNTTILSVAAQVPVLMTEFGYVAGAPEAFDPTMEWADEHGIGYLPWAWWTTVESDDDASKLYALIDDNYAPKVPAGVLYHDHLAELAENPPGGGGGPGIVDYVPVVPDRALDTRAESLTGYAGAKPTAGQVIQLDVTRVGTSQVPDNANAVVLNVTGTDAGASGYVTVWPCGATQPTASNLNLAPGVSSPNLVISKVGADGKVCLFTQSSAHLLADINGYMPSGSRYTPLVPERLLETRAPGQIGYSGDKPAAGATITLQVTGVGASQVPGSAAAAVLNITGTGANTPGFVTVWPCGTSRPNASNLNLAAGGTTPNLVVSKIGQNGTVCIFVQSSMDLIADISGYVPAGSSYVPVVPERLLETRADGQKGYVGGKPATGTIIELGVTGVGTTQVPATATAVVLNVTGVEPDAPGYVTVWPCGSTQPTASNLNLAPGTISPNLVMSKVGAGGKVCIFTQNPTHLIADINGYWP